MEVAEKRKWLAVMMTVFPYFVGTQASSSTCGRTSPTVMSSQLFEEDLRSPIKRAPNDYMEFMNFLPEALKGGFTDKAAKLITDHFNITDPKCQACVRDLLRQVNGMKPGPPVPDSSAAVPPAQSGAYATFKRVANPANMVQYFRASASSENVNALVRTNTNTNTQQRPNTAPSDGTTTLDLVSNLAGQWWTGNSGNDGQKNNKQ